MHRILLEPNHAADELLQTVRAMDDAIMFVDVEVALDFVPHSAWSMLFIEVALVTPRWTCFFWLDQRLEVHVYHEGCPCAIAEVAEGVWTTLPRLGNKEDLAAALHPTTIFLMQVEYDLALEVAHALLGQGKSVSFGRFHVSHGRGEIFDRRNITTA